MSNLNPFRILSNLENGKSEVKELDITGAVIGTVSLFFILWLDQGFVFAIASSEASNTILQSSLILLILAFESFIVIAVFKAYYIINHNKEKIKVNSIKKFTLANVILIILSVLGYLLFFDSLLMPINKMLQGFNLITEITQFMTKSPILYVYAFIIGPVLSEFVFRGIIVGGLLKKYSYKKAILVSALISAIFAFNLAGFMCSFLLGILLGYIYVKTRSLYLCIIADILYNVVTIILIQYYPQFLLLMSTNIIIIAFLSVIGLLIMYFGLKKLFSNFQNTNLQKL